MAGRDACASRHSECRNALRARVDDRVRALLNIILGDDVTERDGGKWIKARWTQRDGVQRVMVLVVERLRQTHLERVRCTGRLAHSYAASCGVKFLGTLYFNH